MTESVGCHGNGYYTILVLTCVHMSTLGCARLPHLLLLHALSLHDKLFLQSEMSLLHTYQSPCLSLQAGRVMATKTQQGFCQLTLDSSNCIQSATLCTSASQSAPNLPPAMLLPLIGLPATYLQDLLRICDSGRTDATGNLPEYLQQPWAGMLYHDAFPQLRSSLIQDLVSSGRPLQELDSNSIAVPNEAAVSDVQTEVVSFVKLRSPVEFPQYDVSAFVS